jgi:hypothetical protein
VNESSGVACASRIVVFLTVALAVLAAALAFSILPAGVSPASAASSSGAVTDEGEAGETGETTTDDPSAQAATYDRMWTHMSRRDKRWARSTAECESGGDPDAIGGGGKFRGAFQFLISTWNRAPKSPGGDPIDYPYRTQAVVAVALMHRDGTGHWPNCG